MGAPDLLHALQGQGFQVWVEGDRLMVAPKARITDETRRLIREHKPELLAVLSGDVLPDPVADARRQRVLAMLADHPEARYATLTDMQADPEAVLLTLAIRGQAMCEFRIPREKWDGALFLELLDRHSLTVH